ncbi:MAG TPA: Uma2 family endonuclease [Pyrinomonadaceae bacterium]|nr:Uma2 family endonuclease [Pyrinomonadaceae bacterium]
MSAVLDLPKTTSIDRIYKAVDIARQQEAAIILSNVSWETYNRFVEETMDKIRNPLFYFENGNLLIMVKSAEHESITDYIVLFINFGSVEWSINCGSLGSTTFRREDLERGFEPDSCFYFENEPKIRGLERLDMNVHPAPDLIIEVDITSLSTFRQNIYAAFGVPEIWRFDGEQMEILKLEKGKYVPISSSISLPLVTPEALTEFIKESKTLSRLEWISKIRNWAREIKTE